MTKSGNVRKKTGKKTIIRSLNQEYSKVTTCIVRLQCIVGVVKGAAMTVGAENRS
jgi:hypothetical protein